MNCIAVGVLSLARLLCRGWISVNSDDEVSSSAASSTSNKRLGDPVGLSLLMDAWSTGIYREMVSGKVSTVLMNIHFVA